MFSVFVMVFLFSQPSVDQVRAAADALFSQKTAGVDISWGPGQVQSSTLGHHVRYQRSYRGISIFDQQPRKVHFDGKLGKVLFKSDALVVSAFPEFGRLNDAQIQFALTRLHRRPKEKPADKTDWQVIDSTRYYRVTPKGVTAVVRLEVTSADQRDRYWLDLDSRTGQIVNRFKRNLNFHPAPQTTSPTTGKTVEGRGTIWRHNPIAAAAAPGDPTNLLVSVPLRGLDGSGYLRGAYVDVLNPYEPVTPDEQSRHWMNYKPGAALEPSLAYHYDPSDPRFEEVSAYYWMDRSQRYLQQRGHHLRETPIVVAVHLTRETNAAYVAETNLIYFGDGLVDTAEDADVVRHEYGHAVLDAACGSRLYDDYGAAFHEGFADFFSFLVGQDAEDEVGPDRYPDFMGEWIGRDRDSQPSYLRTFHKPTFRYPYLTYSPHTDGTLWSSLFYELSLKIGIENTSQLLLETLYRIDSAEPAEVATRLFEVEHMLFEGRYRDPLEKGLVERGLYQTEAHTEVTALGIGSASFEANPGQLRYFRFQAPAGGQDLRVQIQPTTPSTEFVAFLGKNFLPDEYNADTYVEPYYNQGNVSWLLRADGLSRPSLEPGAWYTLGFISFEAPGYEISVEPVSTEPLESWEDGASRRITLQPYEARAFRIGKQAGMAEIGFKRPNADVLMIVSQNAPMTYLDLWDGQAQGVNTDQNFPLLLDLHEMDSLQDKFLTIHNTYGSETTFDLAWATKQTSFIHSLSLDSTQTSVLGEEYENVWMLNLTEEGGRLNFLTDASHPFLMLPPWRFPFPTATWSTLQQGRFTVSATPQQFQTPNNIGAGTALSGSYYILLQGNKGETAEIQANIQPQPVAEWPEGGVRQTLQPRELIKFQFALPMEAERFLIQAQEMTVDANIEISAMPTAGDTLNRLAWQGALTEERPFFQVDNGPHFFSEYEPVFVPGGRYEVWFYNAGQTPQLLQALLTFGVQPPVETLSDGLVVRVPGTGSDYLYQSFEYAVPYWVVPPPGTQRVRLCVEHRGNRFIKAMVAAADGRIQTTHLYESEFSETELRFVPDEPFLLYFARGWSIDMAGDSEFQVELSFLPEGPHRAKLTPEQPSTTLRSISLRSQATELVIPEGQRQVDFSWKGSKPLDTAIAIWADRGLEPPVDAAPVLQGLPWRVQRNDFQLKAPTPFVAMPPESWTLVAEHGPDAGYMPQYFADREPFVFDWLVRYRGFNASWYCQAPRTVGGQAVSQMSLRIQNPNPTAASVTLRSEAGPVVQTIAPGGFAAVELAPGQGQYIESASPLVVFQTQSGDDWATSAAGPAFAADELFLPHVSPDASAWSSYLDAHQEGVTAPQLVDASGQASTPPTSSDEALANPQSLATWRRFSSAIPEGANFRETTLSATQYWQNANQVVAEIPPTRASRTLFVPHVPNNPAWWSGFTLSNTSKREATVSIRIYGPEGPRGDMTSFVLDGGASKVGVLADFLPPELGSHEGAWMRIDSTEELVALEFMGGIHTGDTAGFLLPSRASGSLALPGNLPPGSYGIAFANTIDMAGDVTLTARGADGTVLTQRSWTMTPFQRILLTEGELALPTGQAYTLQIDGPTLELVALQLNVSAEGQLSATAAQPIK